MTTSQPRLRIFAGPNGSGKSTIKEILPPEWLGVYLNADDIERSIRETGTLELSDFNVTISEQELRDFLRKSSLLAKSGLLAEAEKLILVDSEIRFDGVEVNSYYASVLVDLLRHKLLASKVSLTFETVMSSPDKVEFMRKASAEGYRVYLYFVATESPQINIHRVRHRVRTGGHDVPESKIVSRYSRSLGLLYDAVTTSNRAYIFDNSGLQKVWIAEVTDGQELEVKADRMPAWFKSALWDKFDEQPS